MLAGWPISKTTSALHLRGYPIVRTGNWAISTKWRALTQHGKRPPILRFNIRHCRRVNMFFKVRPRQLGAHQPASRNRYPVYHPAVLENCVFKITGNPPNIGYGADYRLRCVELLQRSERMATQNDKVGANGSAFANKPPFYFQLAQCHSVFYHRERQNICQPLFVCIFNPYSKSCNYSQHSYISLEDEIEYLHLYLEIKSLRFKDKFTYTLTLSPKSCQAKSVFTMFIQPYIENALQHGLLSKTEGSRLLTIHFEQILPDVLQCIITDNGIGRASAKERTQGRHGAGIGSVNPQARLSILNRLLKKPIR